MKKHRNFLATQGFFGVFLLVEHRGFEPLTSTLPVLRAPNCANAPMNASIIYDFFALVKGVFYFLYFIWFVS